MRKSRIADKKKKRSTTVEEKIETFVVVDAREQLCTKTTQSFVEPSLLHQQKWRDRKKGKREREGV